MSPMRYQQPCIDDTAGLGGKRDLLSNVVRKFFFSERSNIERGMVINLGQRPHHLRKRTKILGVNGAGNGRDDEGNEARQRLSARNGRSRCGKVVQLGFREFVLV